MLLLLPREPNEFLQASVDPDPHSPTYVITCDAALSPYTFSVKLLTHKAKLQ